MKYACDFSPTAAIPFEKIFHEKVRFSYRGNSMIHESFPRKIPKKIRNPYFSRQLHHSRNISGRPVGTCHPVVDVWDTNHMGNLQYGDF